jgi:hypothetical protein
MRTIKSMDKFRLYVIVMMLLSAHAEAQISTDSAMGLLKKMSIVYANTPYLGFDMTYKYMNESAPSDVIDSLSGRIELNKRDYRFSLGTTQSICNKNYNIILFGEDTLMYIVKPSSQQPFAALALLDSMMLKVQGLDIREDISGGNILLKIMFPQGMLYKTLEYKIDAATGYLRQSKCVMKASALAGTSFQTPGLGKPGMQGDDWGIVESVYFNYQTGQFDDNEFDASRYFTKEGTQFKTTPAYSRYKIFLGSPNL